MTRVILLGGGGHCRSVLDAIRTRAELDPVGILDVPEKLGQVVDGLAIIGTEDQLPTLLAQGVTHAFITVGSLEDSSLRRKLAERCQAVGFTFPVVIDASAVVAASVCLGAGAFVGKRAVLNAGAAIGEHAIINTGALIEHDCEIGAFTHVAPGATVCGDVHIGARTLIGAASVVIQGRRIGHDCLVGAGTVVLRDVAAGVTVVGNPARQVPR